MKSWSTRWVATFSRRSKRIRSFIWPSTATRPARASKSGLWLDEEELPLGELADLMAGRCGNRVVYFGACSTMETDGRRLNTFLQKTKAKAVCGYKEEVDWVESTAFDLLFLGKIQSETLRRRDSLERFDQTLRETAPRLYRDLGFRMVVR